MAIRLLRSREPNYIRAGADPGHTYTWAGWFWFENLHPAGDWVNLSIRGSDVYNDLPEIEPHATDGSGRFSYWNNGAAGSVSDYILRPGYWVHIAVVRPGTSGTGTIYYNGSAVATNTMTSFTGANIAWGNNLVPGDNMTGAISAADATLTGALTVQTIDHASGPNLQYGGSTKLAIVSTGATVTGVLTTSGDMVIGSSDSTPSLTIGQAAALSTGDASIELGYGRTGSGNSYIDIVGDATYTDYGLRIIRANSGADAPSSIIHRGTGDLNLRTNEAGAIKLRTNNTLRATVQSSGELIAEYGVYVNGDQGGISGYVGLTDVTTGVSTGTGTVRMNSTSSGVASAGWLKAYVGTTTIYIPYWTSMS